MSKRALVLNSSDNVANVLEDVAAGDLVEAREGQSVTSLTAIDDVPFGFKIALADVSLGEFVIKYGERIGKASQPIRRGSMVHIHNLEGTRGRGDLHSAK
jgi:altronate dehydratase small subunit